MILKIKNRSNLISTFLNPISKISERCIIKIEKDHLSSLVATPDGTLILYTKFDHETESSDDETVTLNIADLNKIIKILSYIDKDDIEVELKDSALTVRNKATDKTIDEKGNGVIHKGISTRQFERSFTISEDIKVKDAELKNGLLIIELERIIPDEKKSRLIDIK